MSGWARTTNSGLSLRKRPQRRRHDVAQAQPRQRLADEGGLAGRIGRRRRPRSTPLRPRSAGGTRAAAAAMRGFDARHQRLPGRRRRPAPAPAALDDAPHVGAVARLQRQHPQAQRLQPLDRARRTAASTRSGLSATMRSICASSRPPSLGSARTAAGQLEKRSVPTRRAQARSAHTLSVSEGSSDDDALRRRRQRERAAAVVGDLHARPRQRQPAPRQSSAPGRARSIALPAASCSMPARHRRSAAPARPAGPGPGSRAPVRSRRSVAFSSLACELPGAARSASARSGPASSRPPAARRRRAARRRAAALAAQLPRRRRPVDAQRCLVRGAARQALAGVVVRGVQPVQLRASAASAPARCAAASVTPCSSARLMLRRSRSRGRVGGQRLRSAW